MASDLHSDDFSDDERGECVLRDENDVMRDEIDSLTVEPAPPKERTAEEYVRMLNTGMRLFFHGPGGSGKSYMTKQILKILDEDKTKYAVLFYGRKPAINFGCGATNIHQFFGLLPPELEGKPIKVKLDECTKSLANRMKGSGGKFYTRMLKMLRDGMFGSNGFTKMVQDILTNILDTDVLVIDEISTVGKEIFELMDAVARKYRESELPFGGMRLILSGDMLQTSPVKDKYPFASELWGRLNLVYCPFNNIYRFKDKSWAELLLRMRRGICTQNDFDRLRAMVGQKTDILTQTTYQATMMKICATRKEVTEHNNRSVDRITGQGFRFRAGDTVWNVYGDTRREQIFDAEKVEKHLSMYEEDIGIDRELRLKVGARVMLLRNMKDPYIANGQLGEVIGFLFEEKEGKKIATHVQVKIDGASEPVDIPKVTASQKFMKGALMVERKQFPMRPAYAATTQKVQGETQQYTKLDYGKRVAAGVAYVGFSRAVSPENIELVSFVGSCINVDRDALKFVSKLEGWDEADESDANAAAEYTISYERDEDPNGLDDGW